MKNHRKKFPKIPLIVSLLFFTVSFSAFLFLYQQVQKQKTEAETIRLEAQNKETQIENARLLTNFLEETASAQQELERHFVYQDDVVPLLRFIENIGFRVGGQAEVVGVEVTVDGQELFVESVVKGNFDAAYKFITLLENAPYKVEFLSVEMKTILGDESSGGWRGDIRMKVISFVPESEDEN